MSWMSLDTIGSSVYSRIPFNRPSAAASRYAALISSTVRSSRSEMIVRSTIEPVGTGTRYEEPLELAVELGHHVPDGLGGTGRRGNDVDGCGTGATQVAVRAVLQVLISRVRVCCHHEAALDAELVVEHLRERGEAVRGARGVGDDAVVRRVVGLFVHAHDERAVDVRSRSGDDDLLGATGDVLASICGLGEATGRLDDDVDAQVAPREVGRDRALRKP